MQRGMKTFSMLLAVTGLCAIATVRSHGGVMGHIVIAGHGPELPVMQDLGRAFEKANPGTAIDFEWDRAVKAVEMVKSGAAQIAVTDRPDPALRAVPIAWDGIAVVVNFANPVKEVTTSQVRDLFTGKITRWSDLDAGDQRVEVLPRAPEDNVQAGLETSLGIVGQFRPSGKAVRTDDMALRAVSGRDGAITAISLVSALKAQEDGIPVRILPVDKIEPGSPTVQSGDYKLRRPVLFLTGPHPDAVTEAFVGFASSSEGQRILQSTFVPHVPGVLEFILPPSHLADDQSPPPGKKS